MQQKREFLIFILVKINKYKKIKGLGKYGRLHFWTIMPTRSSNHRMRCLIPVMH